MDVPKILENNCEGDVSSQHENVSQSLSKRDVDVATPDVDVHHTLGFDHDDSFEGMPSLVNVSSVVEHNKQTSPKNDLIPFGGLALFNSFASFPIMDDVIP